ncbi:uncharacterized protein N7483_006151 [Penicillium malachiteum]|uniref:uncharacterized protein n=1 Tax=Penicillium malachiteum TaxID=1324776 RepID=UPI002547FF1B|nr:uncharacterized protein N7483_006151 [Penicillium malachiteum]KAJ5731643.1 hypothetical protein N7483_006151 [Penicillium malachiteum]
MSAPKNPRDSMKSTWRRDESPHPSKDRQDTISAKLAVPSLHHNLRWSPTGRAPAIRGRDRISTPPGYCIHLLLPSCPIFAFRELRSIREVGHTFGFLDGDQHERDGVPDAGVGKTLLSVFLAGFLRPLFSIYLSYNMNKPPASLNWKWLPLEIGVYSIIVDFWFYWYHCLMHDVNGLWKFHRTHHLTKHPNPLLKIYADSVQEFFDIAGIPLMAYFTMKFMGFPMG